ncbi:hypothetical protein D7Z54_32920 [Salibacterium salarium]|uniref:Uncharacterized protein n=1 Tax=Salibacterium salarium TaxID=284579 RepID=A0A3R9PXG2_9BACI|nr:hypothetical protein D7Z54_32920 [Salibacterium salarium]
MSYTFTDDYKKEFSRYVCVIASESTTDTAEDIAKVHRLTDDYVEQTGERPDHTELDELASLIRFGRKGLTNRKKSDVKAYEQEAVSHG